MIDHLSITNFKSIAHLAIDCKRVNLFIGEPNTGKSNILEALGLLCWCGNKKGVESLKEYIRFDHMNNLYYDGVLDEPIKIDVKGNPQFSIQVIYENDYFNVTSSGINDPIARLSFKGEWNNRAFIQNPAVMFYRFPVSATINDGNAGPLLPPQGKNLFMVAYGSKQNRGMLSNLFSPYNLDVVFKPQERKIEIQKKEGNIAISYPYTMMSDTLQRMVFYLLAIRSNKNAVLVFEEPEAHAFPYYTKHLGEVIADDHTNQYFVATHNPYLLSAIVEKTRQEDINVCITYYRNYQTKVKQLSPDELSRLLDEDPFLALDHYIGE